jgi:hypothetical protein
MGLVPHLPSINIVLTFQSKLNDIDVCDQLCFVHTCHHNLLDNFVIYELTLFHIYLVHVMSCHNYNELPHVHQPINVMFVEAYCIKKKPTLQCPMVRFYASLCILIRVW